MNYGVANDIRQKFTGYLKDEETQLDFAEARMYENRHARFTAVDPLLASGKSSNSQTFNRYVYVGNSPLVLTDPTGLFGDYYDRKGNKLGSDKKGTPGYNDGKVYFADELYLSGSDVTVHNIVEVRMWQVLHMQRLTKWYTPHQPGDGREEFWRLGHAVTNGVNDALTGIPKGIGNAPVVLLNGITDSATQGGLVPQLIFQGRNPFAAPLLFAYNNEREASYGSAGSTGTILGVGFAAGAIFGASPMPSVVPQSIVRTGGSEIIKITTRTGRKGENAVEIIFSNGNKKDISPFRTKEWVPNNHPNAPSGTMQKVRFKDSIPGSKDYKRQPTAEEIEFLNSLFQ
ncbi:MAG: hypothetical protein KIS76_06105 [Pyrinomonadaceae bacterium]|nr:hypothetical protein [Pyrinomonadaceae bacterium]